MITTGLQNSLATRKTEVVDLANGHTCSDLADFPVELYASVSANLDGTPVVCGGRTGTSTYSEKCFRFTNGEWEEFASMKEQRGYAAGVVYNKKLHVFGGTDGSSILQTSEIINVDGEVSNGPDLPAGVFRHAMTTINDTVSLLSANANYYSAYSAKTWYYNHDTEAFMSGPDLLEGRRRHGSATNVDKVTKAKIAIITGGDNIKFGKMDSTELLINGQWETGTIQKCFD